ncbi:MAG: hypothetical protein H9535_15515 [Ignavibacteria bacterium]|nr:hypothetical protein [Ignavibacteria bacterium]
MKTSSLRIYGVLLCAVVFIVSYAPTARAQSSVWQRTAGPNGGAVNCFTTLNSTIFAGTSGSGVYRSVNNGASWSPIGKLLSGSSIQALAASNSTLFAVVRGYLVRSDDNGITWLYSSEVNSYSLRSVLVHNQSVYVIGGDGRILRSDDNGLSWSVLYRTVPDTVQNGNSTYISSVGISTLAASGSKVVAVTDKGTLLRSADRGSTWTTSSPALFYSTSNYSGRFRAATMPDSNSILVASDTGILRSTDNGATWLTINSSQVLSFLQQNSQIIFAAASNGVLRSVNGGSSWTSFGNSLSGRSVSALSMNSVRLLAGLSSDPGIMGSTDNAQSWSLSNSGLTASTLQKLTAIGTSLFASNGNNILRSVDNGSTWTNLFADGASVGANAMVNQGTALFLSTSSGISRSTDNGATWTTLNSGLINGGRIISITALASSSNDIYGVSQASYQSNNNYASNIYRLSGNNSAWQLIGVADSLYWNVVDIAATGSALYLSAYDRILRSTDNGSTWQRVWTRSTTGNISSVGNFAINGTTVYVGTSNGLLRSDNNGTTWQSGGLGNQNITRIIVSDSTLVASTASGQVFFSRDNGATWSGTEIVGLNGDYYSNSINSLAVIGSSVFASVSRNGIYRSSLTPDNPNSSCITTLTTLDGTLRDRPNLNAEYANNTDCRWLIKPSSTGRIILSFSRFATEADYDFVTIYDGETISSPQIARMSGTNLYYSPLIARSGAMLIRFTSDSSFTSSGWSASYNVTPNASEAFTPPVPISPLNNATDISAYLSLTVRLNADANPGDVIRFQVATDSLFTNNVTRFDVSVSNFYSRQSSIYGYASLRQGTRYFWRATHLADTALAPRWSAVSSFTTRAATCTGTTTFTSNAGSFSDRVGNESGYSNNLDCSWLIQPANGGRITLAFSRFSTESCCDAVTIYDGTTINSRVLGTFRGSAIPSSVTSSGGVMLVRFTTDGSGTSTGWAASYTAGGASPVDTTAVNANRELRIPSVSVVPGTIAIPVTVSGLTGQNVLSCQMTVTFDTTRIRLTGVSAAGTLADSSTITVNTGTPGRLTFTLFRPRPFAGNGTLINLTGTTVASSGQTTININNALFNEGSPSVNIFGGVVTIGGFLCGDVSRNGTVTALDASLVAEHSVGTRRLTGDSLRAADVSGNRQVTGYDAALIAQYTAGLINSFPNGCPPVTVVLASSLKEFQKSSLTANESVSLAIEDAHQQRDNHYIIPLRLTNSRSLDIRSYSFAVRFNPAIVNLSGVSLDETLSEGGTLVVNTMEAGIIRGVYFSSRGFAESGTLLNLHAEVRSSGRSTLTLEHTMFNEGSPSVVTQNGSIGLQATSVRSQHFGNTDAALSVFPAPASESINFSLSLSNPIPVTLVLSTILGQEVARIHDGTLSAGEHRLLWNVQSLPSGVYVASLQSAGIHLNSVLVHIVR